MTKFNRDDVFLYIGATLFAYATFLIIYQMHTHENWDELIAVSNGVLEGRPPWRAYQNRLLMPFFISIIDTFVDQKKVFTSIYLCAIMFHNLLIAKLIRRDYGIFPAWSAIILWSFLFCLYQNYYLYPWDMFDLSIFSLVAYILLGEKKAEILLFLFPLALLNRESALFLPVAYWLSVNNHLFFNIKNTISAVFSRSTIIVITIIFAGMIWTKFIRDWLFIESASGNQDVTHALIGNHIYLFLNLKNFIFTNWLSSHYWIFSLVTIIMAIFLIKEFFKPLLGITRSTIYLFFFLLANILIFGIFNETRMQFPLLSIYVFIFAKYLSTKQIRQN